MKKRDLIVILCALLAAGILFLISQLSLGGEMATVVATLDGEEVLRKPLAVAGTYEIRQEDGSVNVIAVEAGAAYMQEANCRDGLCIRQGRMKSAAKSIVCLPHKLVVQLSGEEILTQESDLDVIIQ